MSVAELQNVSISPHGFYESPNGYGGVLYDIMTPDAASPIGAFCLSTFDTSAEYYEGKGVVIEHHDAWLLNIDIDAGYQGEGYGLAAYRKIAEEVEAMGREFRSDPEVLTKHSKKIWDIFVDEGLAICEVEPTLDEAGDYVGGVYRYIGGEVAA